MSAPLAWITGAGGLIGNYLVQTAPDYAPGWQVIGWTRSELDLTDFAAVRQAFAARKPDLVLHCAALSRNPDCEANPPLAHRLNVELTVFLAELAADVPFFFFSTDLVFDGKQGNYDETAPVSPLGVYPQTKAAAEQAVLQNPKHSVLRLSLNGGISPTGDRGFNEQMRRAWQAGKTLNLFADEFRAPMSAQVTARAVWELAARAQPGLYHLAGSERLSRCQIGQLLARRWPHLEARLEPGSLRDYVGPPRAPDTFLNCGKVQPLLSFPLPAFSQWLAENPEVPF